MIIVFLYSRNILFYIYISGFQVLKTNPNSRKTREYTFIYMYIIFLYNFIMKMARVTSKRYPIQWFVVVFTSPSLRSVRHSSFYVHVLYPTVLLQRVRFYRTIILDVPIYTCNNTRRVYIYIYIYIYYHYLFRYRRHASVIKIRDA